MQKFTIHTGIVAPLDRDNVDTDAVIPKQFLKSITRTGFGQNLFDAWRYLDNGESHQRSSQRIPNPEFVLNQPRYQSASILLTRKNFGCGSSREHAVWALQQHGFRAIIAPSYADIFYNNCFKNGLLPVILTDPQIDQLFDDTHAYTGYTLTIDLNAQLVQLQLQLQRRDNHPLYYSFDIAPFHKTRLLNGLDDINLTLRYADEIQQFEAKRLTEQPWLAML